MQFGDLFRIVGGIEIAVALVCFYSKQSWLQAGLVAWLGTSFLAYHEWPISQKSKTGTSSPGRQTGLSMRWQDSATSLGKLCVYTSPSIWGSHPKLGWLNNDSFRPSHSCASPLPSRKPPRVWAISSRQTSRASSIVTLR